MILTLYQLVNRINRLLAIIRISISVRKNRRSMKNFVMQVFEAMYHVENYRLDHDTNKPKGRNVRE